MSFSISTTFNQYKLYFYLGIALVFIFLVGSTISLYKLNESKNQTISELKKSNDEKNQMLLKLQEDIKKKVEQLQAVNDSFSEIEEIYQKEIFNLMQQLIVQENDVDKLTQTINQQFNSTLKFLAGATNYAEKSSN